MRSRSGSRRDGKKSRLVSHMDGMPKDCLHLGGLRVVSGAEFRCPACEERLDLDAVVRWVREAEQDRDDAYSMVEGDEFEKIVYEEWQREVYRRRKVLYDLQNPSHVVTARPEMVLVSFESGGVSGFYECKIFYKEPRPELGLEALTVEATLEAVLELRSDANAVIRTVAGKIEELHEARRVAEGDADIPLRRVFYANEL